jgi:hypothetical protein
VKGTILLRSGDLSGDLYFDHAGHTQKDLWIHHRVCVGFPVKEPKSQSVSRGRFRMILIGLHPEGSGVCITRPPTSKITDLVNLVHMDPFHHDAYKEAYTIDEDFKEVFQ